MCSKARLAVYWRGLALNLASWTEDGRKSTAQGISMVAGVHLLSLVVITTTTLNQKSY